MSYRFCSILTVNALTDSVSLRPPTVHDDLVIQYQGQNTSLQRLMVLLNASKPAAGFCIEEEYSCADHCRTRHSAEHHRQYELPCYCDAMCLHLGDCCYDFYSR